MNKTLLAFGAASALLFASGAWAQGYGGIGAGPSRINIDCGGADSCDKTGTGFKVYGGMTFASQFAVEGVYFDWGKARASATDVELGTGALKVKGTGFGIGVAYFPALASNWTGALRLGVARNKGKTTADLGGLSASDSFSGTYAYYGLGVGYKLTPNLAVTGEVDFSRLKYTDEDKADTQLLTVGVRYAF